MKILHIIDNMGIGGAQTILKGIFENYISNENIYCYSLRNNKTEVKVNHPNVYSHVGYSKFNIRSLFELRTFVQDHDIDVLHYHLTKSMFFGYILKIVCFKNIKLIFHEHGMIFQNKVWYRHFLRNTQRNVELYIAVSEATKRLLNESAGIMENKIKVLYNFVNLNQFDSQKFEINRLEEREKLGLNDDNFILGFAGRHVERKGCRDLIFGLKCLEQFKNIKLFIAGDGPKKEEYKNLANKLELDQNIFFLGFVPDIRWLYSIIDCFVIPSHWEPLGIVALEAHAMGIPVIASNIEGLNEVVLDKKTGLLFEPKNEKDLAKKIELMYNDKNLRIELIKNGLYEVKKYSLDNYLSTLGEIYDEHR